MKLTKLGLALMIVILLAIAARFAGAMNPQHPVTTQNSSSQQH